MKLTIDMVAEDGDSVALETVRLDCRDLEASKEEVRRLFALALDRLLTQLDEQA